MTRANHPPSETPAGFVAVLDDTTLAIPDRLLAETIMKHGDLSRTIEEMQQISLDDDITPT